MASSEEIRRHIRVQLGDQQVLVRSLLALREQLQGSLIERYGVCGKPNCACRLGRRHGPYYVLSSRSGGKGGYTYLDGKQVERARGLVERHREFRSGMQQLRKLNEGIVTLLKSYQSAVTHQAGRQLGILEPR
jgi:hypothetical protein